MSTREDTVAEYTPTTDEVEELYGIGWFADEERTDRGSEPLGEFRRWLVRDRDAVAEQVLDGLYQELSRWLDEAQLEEWADALTAVRHEVAERAGRIRATAGQAHRPSTADDDTATTTIEDALPIIERAEQEYRGGSRHGRHRAIIRALADGGMLTFAHPDTVATRERTSS